MQVAIEKSGPAASRPGWRIPLLGGHRARARSDAVVRAASPAGEARTLLRMDDYSPQAKAFWWLTVSLGTIAFAIAVVTIARYEREYILQIVLGTAMAAATGFFPLRLHGAKTSIAAAEIFTFLLLLLYGPAAAAFATAAEAAVGSWRTSTRWTSRIGSPAMAGLAMYGCGGVFSVAVAQLSHAGATSRAYVFAGLLVFALLYFAANTLLMASLISLKRGEPVRPFSLLRQHAWLGYVYAASASIAGLLFLSFTEFGAGVLLAAGPIIAMFLSTLHFYFNQTEAKQRADQERMAAVEREARENARHLTELQASENRFHSAFRHAAIGMALVSADRRILQANPALCNLLEQPETALVGTELAAVAHPDDVVALDRELSGLLDGSGSTFAIELRCRHARGLETWAALTGAVFAPGDTPGARCLIVQMQDITARRQAENQLQHIAFHDSLTELPNRGHFVRRLARAIAAYKRDSQHRFAVLYLDFDRFKLVNDSLGHDAGDELLVVLAQRIKGHLRAVDMVARLGGDEFAVLVESIQSERQVTDLAERLQTVLREPIRLRSAEVSTTVSIGITTSAFNYASPDEVMRDADTAMYRAKTQGKARYALFDSTLHAQVSSQLWLEAELRRAIEREQFELVYQPIYDLRTGDVAGIEALCRWPHPEQGPIAPQQFIRIAEETGLIVPLGNWVLRKACRQLGAWQRSRPELAGVGLHVNVSGIQLAQADFALQVKHALADADLRPTQLTLEVTESVVVEKLSDALPNLLQLRETGVQISVDDFGTGYSSFSVLHDLPIGEIKVDRSFVSRIGKCGEGEEVVRAIVAMGRALGKRVVAEGIETDAQRTVLLELGCTRGQGFLLSGPMRAGDLDFAPDSFEPLERAA